MSDFKFEQLENEFKTALYRFDQGRCQEIIDAFQIHNTYLKGIFEYIFNGNSSQAEHLLSSLLDYELDLPMQAKVYRALGNCQDSQGNFEYTLASYQQSLTISEQLNSPLQQAMDLQNMGISCSRGFACGQFSKEKLQEGITFCHNALGLIQEHSVNSDEQLLLGRIWNTLGVLHMNADQWGDAIRCLRCSLSLYQELDMQGLVGHSYNNLAEVYLKQGPSYWDESQSMYEKALQLIQDTGDTNGEVDVLANLGYLSQIRGESQTALDFYEKAISHIENHRERITSLKARASFFTTMIDTYDNTILLCLDMNQPELAFHYAERARARTYLDTLVTASIEIATPDSADLSVLALSQIQEQLPADTLLLSYFTTGLIEASDGRQQRDRPKRHRFPQEQTLLFAITRTTFHYYKLDISPNRIKVPEIGKRIVRFVNNSAFLQKRYAELIEPISSMLPDKRRLILAPHGPLHSVPFQALVTKDNQPLLHKQGPQLTFIPSASFFCQQPKIKQSPINNSCLAFGYNGDGVNLPQLIFGEFEAQAIAQQIDGKVVFGESPKKDVLFQEGEAYQIIHFSCHGNFDPNQPLQSTLYLGPNEILTAEEVHQKLTLNCDLVVMSACESGVSEVIRGDEMMGLVRAFIHAGARAVIATLWKVGDFATQIVMEKFYEEVNKSRDDMLDIQPDFATALHHAQTYLRDLSKEAALEHLQEFTQDKAIDMTTVQSIRTSLMQGEKNPFAKPVDWAPFYLVADLNQVSQMEM